MILAQRWGQNPQHILQDLKVLHRCLRTAPVCHDNTAGCVSHGPGLCFVAGVLLFRVGSLQIAEQQVSITSGIHHFWNTNCILYIVKLKGIRLPFIRIAVVQANQASFYWREQDLTRFVTPPILKSSRNFFFWLYCFILSLVHNLPDLHPLKTRESQAQNNKLNELG